MIPSQKISKNLLIGKHCKLRKQTLLDPDLKVDISRDINLNIINNLNLMDLGVTLELSNANSLTQVMLVHMERDALLLTEIKNWGQLKCNKTTWCQCHKCQCLNLIIWVVQEVMKCHPQIWCKWWEAMKIKCLCSNIPNHSSWTLWWVV